MAAAARSDMRAARALRASKRAAVLTAALASAVFLPLATAQTAGPSAGPKPPAPERPSFLGTKSAALVGEHLDGTPFNIPQGVYFDADHGEVFVADTGNGLIGIFDADGVPKFTFSLGPGPSYPIAITTDPEGNIYVLNAGAPKVQVFTFRGEPLREIDPGEVEKVRPAFAGMARGPDGRLYLLDTAAGRVIVCDLEGRITRIIRGSGKGGSRLQAPYAAAFDAEGNLYVTDRRGTPVQVYDPFGKFLRGWGKRDVGPEDFSTPAGIAVDPYGCVLVADPIRQDVKVFNPDGGFYDRLGGYGQGAEEMAYPTGVAAGRVGRIYVVERVNRRLQILDRIPLSDAPSRAEPRSPAAPPQNSAP